MYLVSKKKKKHMQGKRRKRKEKEGREGKSGEGGLKEGQTYVLCLSRMETCVSGLPL